MRIAYLIARYPAINHNYLLQEIHELRRLGIEVLTASVNSPDRPTDKLRADEREEEAGTLYIKSTPKAAIVGALAKTFVQRPGVFVRELFGAIALADANPKSVLYYLFYFAEAALVGQWMLRHGVNHVHVSFAQIVGLMTARLFPVTMSLGVYGLGELHDPVGGRLAQKISAALFIRSISKHGRSSLMMACEADAWHKMDYVPLGVEPSELPVCPFRDQPAPFVFTTVGRLAKEKGLSLLVEAFALVCETHPDCKLRIVGDGPERAALDTQIRRLGLSGKVVLEGWVSQQTLLDIYSLTDAFAMASLYEGIPIVLMEAMCMGIPCIAPHITGIPELIENHEDGLMFIAADVADLAGCMRRVVAYPELRRQFATRGREKVLREYDIAKNTARLAALFQAKLAARPAVEQPAALVG